MGEHPNIEKLRKGYDAFKNQDMNTLSELFAGDIVWHAAGVGKLSGDYKGQEEVFGFFMQLMQETGGTLTIEVEDMFANDERGVVLQRVSADRNGEHLDNYTANVFQIDRDAKVTEVWNMSVDTEVGNRFFG